jgi:hypothetical protein
MRLNRLRAGVRKPLPDPLFSTGRAMSHRAATPFFLLAQTISVVSLSGAITGYFYPQKVYSVVGTVTFSGFHHAKSGRYYPAIGYDYEVGGKAFKWTSSLPSREDLKDYPVGRRVELYFQADRPDVTFLAPPSFGFDAFVTYLLIGLVLQVGAIIVYTRKRPGSSP